MQPFYVAMGLGDGSVCIMDRRMTGSPLSGISPDQLAHRACSYRYKDNSRACSKPYKITSVQFNEYGSELLVSYSEDYLYLLNSQIIGCGSKRREPNRQSQRHTNVPSKRRSRHHCKGNLEASAAAVNPNAKTGTVPSKPDEEVSPPIKRLRLRGDWSDTGPEARPEDQADVPRNTFMNRMSHMFSQWINETLSSPLVDDEQPPPADLSPSPSLEDSSDDGSSIQSSFESTPSCISESSDSLTNSTFLLTSAMASCTTNSPSKNSESVNDGAGSQLQDGRISDTCSVGDSFSNNEHNGDSNSSTTLHLAPSLQEPHSHSPPSSDLFTAHHHSPHHINTQNSAVPSGVNEDVNTLYFQEDSESHTVESTSIHEDSLSHSVESASPKLKREDTGEEQQLSQSRTSTSESDEPDFHTSEKNPENYLTEEREGYTYEQEIEESTDSIGIKHYHGQCLEVTDHVMQYKGHRNSRTMVSLPCSTRCLHVHSFAVLLVKYCKCIQYIDC